MYSIPNIRISSPRDLRRPLPAAAPTVRRPPEAKYLRDERAMTPVAHLLPENAAEVAVLVVAAPAPRCVPRPDRVSSPTKPDAVPPRPPP